MRICYLDAFSGISGDMFVGATVDAGADPSQLTQALQSLGTGAAFRFEKVKRRGLAATKFTVEFASTHTHRHLPQILELIDAADLPDKVKENAKAVFTRLARAEALVHDMPPEQIHFHEVGAVDSIADIVGACFGLYLLGIQEVHCSPVNVGSGTVHTEHGTLPVPAPATAALLTGKPVFSQGPSLELTTPTGAALAVTLSSRFGPPPPMTLEAVGYGAGGYDFPEHPNVLRILVGTPTGATEATRVAVIETNLDDVTPQVLGFLMDRLLAAGALDVSFSPIFMKKNRPATLLRVIARPEDQETLAQIIFSETPTFGLRIYSAERRVQARRHMEVETPYGKVRVKVATSGAFSPEFEDCKNLALRAGIPLKEILTEASLAYLRTKK